MRDMTVCFLIRHTPAHQVLLGFKKRGFAAGKYAGIGGRVEADETIRAAASRELYEETGILASYSDLQAMGGDHVSLSQSTGVGSDRPCLCGHPLDGRGERERGDAPSMVSHRCATIRADVG